MFFSEKYLEMVETSETSQATVGESTNIGLDQDVKKGEMDTNEAFNHPLATSWWPVGDRKSELTELEALHMRYVRMNHIDISYTQRFMITRCLYLSVSKYVIYIYILCPYMLTREAIDSFTDLCPRAAGVRWVPWRLSRELLDPEIMFFLHETLRSCECILF